MVLRRGADGQVEQRPMRVQIDPHADLQAPPRSLYWGERRIEIIEIIEIIDQ
jgi:hypothetical protein